MGRVLEKPRCGAKVAVGESPTVSLPVVRASGEARLTTVRPSRTSRWRALSLVAVHVLILVHIAHWLIAGRTLSPVEPSETMYALNDGHINAGLIFFGAAIAGTLVFGRFVCGWGCHVIAYQDLCHWLLKKIGIKAKPFRSRLLVYAPLALALYMFVWPSAYRWWVGAPPPTFTNHLMKADFWETFPGPVIAALTIVVCGFVIVYFLGAKGFCTYACPYGGFFRIADRFSPGRILVTDACEHCGHCTATCTSNVKVHEEVALYGMVVDPGCMKCMDCVSVCPNDALYFGFGRPSIGVQPESPRKPPAYDFALWEEIAMAVAGAAGLLVFRGLYGQIPLLLAMAMGALTGYFFVKTAQLAAVSNVRLQNLSLKRGGRLTQPGMVFAAMIALFTAFTAHSALIRYHGWRGHRLMESLAIGDEVWSAGGKRWEQASADQRSRLEAAVRHLQRADARGLLPTPQVLTDLIWVNLALERNGEAESAARRVVELSPYEPAPYRALAGVLNKMGRGSEAEETYRRALTLDDSFAPARVDLGRMLVSHGRAEEALQLYGEAVASSRGEPHWRVASAKLLLDLGRSEEAKGILVESGANAPGTATGCTLSGIASVQMGDRAEALLLFRKALNLEPLHGDAHYNLGMMLLEERKLEEAVVHLQTAVKSNPSFALGHYNLAVATFMAGRPTDALSPIREAIRLEPDNADAYGFLSVILRELGDAEAADAAARHAKSLKTPQ